MTREEQLKKIAHVWYKYTFVSKAKYRSLNEQRKFVENVFYEYFVSAGNTSLTTNSENMRLYLSEKLGDFSFSKSMSIKLKDPIIFCVEGCWVHLEDI